MGVMALSVVPFKPSVRILSSPRYSTTSTLALIPPSTASLAVWMFSGRIPTRTGVSMASLGMVSSTDQAIGLSPFLRETRCSPDTVPVMKFMAGSPMNPATNWLVGVL